MRRLLFVCLIGLLMGCSITQNNYPLFTEVVKFEIDNASRVLDVVAIGKIVYVANFEQGISVYDLEDADKPKLLEIIYTGGSAQRFYLHDTLLFVANRDYGIRVYNVKTPKNPTLIKSSDITHTLGICGDDNYAYSAGQSGIVIFDITGDGTEVGIVSQIEELSTSNNCFAEGGYLYSANWENGTSIIDISNIEDPQIVKTYSTAHYSSEVVKLNNYLLSADGSNGVRIFDISSPNSSYEVGFVSVGDEVLDIATDGENLVFAGTLSSGVYIIEMSENGEGNVLGHFKDTSDSRGIFFIDGYIYIASQTYGSVSVIKVKEDISE